MAFGNVVIKSWLTVPWTFSLGVTTDGRNIIVSDISPATILFLDSDLSKGSLTVIKSFTPPTAMHGLSYDGKYLWGVSNGTDSVYQFTTEGTLIKSWSVGAGVVLGITTDELYVYVNFNDNIRQYTKDGVLIRDCIITGTLGGNRELTHDGHQLIQSDTAGLTFINDCSVATQTFARNSNGLLPMGDSRYLNVRQTFAQLLY